MFEFFITRPMGFIINLIYELVQNYGLAIIIFTILIKLVIMPLSVKSQKSMKKQQKIQPYLAELQKKYANDKEKLQMETMKLYKENNISMTGGCLPLLLQFPILIGLYSVIRKPIEYLLGVDFSLTENISKVTNVISQMTSLHPNTIGDYAQQTAEQIINNEQIRLSTWCGTLNPSDPWVINFDFFGLDLSTAPLVSVNYILSGQFLNIENLSRVLLILIPLVAIFTTWLSMRQSQKMNKLPESAQDTPAAGMNKSMNFIMPIFTGIFTFTLPAGLGLYWIVSNLMQMFQQTALNYYFKKKGEDFDVKIPERNRKNGKKR